MKNVGHFATHIAPIKDLDQTAHLHGMIRDFGLCTCQLVPFAVF